MYEAKSARYVLTVNAGSSSIKCALFAIGGTLEKVSQAAVENIDQETAWLHTPEGPRAVSVGSHAEAAHMLLEWFSRHFAQHAVVVVGHRIVHGGSRYHQAHIATAEVLADVRQLIPFDPAHLPVELKLVEELRRIFPDAQHVLCFDTAFHHTLPARARLLPLPRRFAEEGVRRYGFHGLSYEYVVRELRRVEGDAAAEGKVIIAHLGSGASLAALKGGVSVDTTMSMTPASGIPMSTRAGDLDPGLSLYFAHRYDYDAEHFARMATFESGLLGISGISADMKTLLELRDHDEHAKNAVDVFCYQAKKSIGSFAAALGGLNTLVFTGGMGENAPKIRAAICEDMEFLGIMLDDARNQEGARLISADGSPVGVHVIATDESQPIAQASVDLLEKKAEGNTYGSIT